MSVCLWLQWLSSCVHDRHHNRIHAALSQTGTDPKTLPRYRFFQAFTTVLPLNAVFSLKPWRLLVAEWPKGIVINTFFYITKCCITINNTVKWLTHFHCDDTCDNYLFCFCYRHIQQDWPCQADPVVTWLQCCHGYVGVRRLIAMECFRSSPHLHSGRGFCVGGHEKSHREPVHTSFNLNFFDFCLCALRYRSDGTKKEPIKISSMVRNSLKWRKKV